MRSYARALLRSIARHSQLTPKPPDPYAVRSGCCVSRLAALPPRWYPQFARGHPWHSAQSKRRKVACPLYPLDIAPTKFPGGGVVARIEKTDVFSMQQEFGGRLLYLDKDKKPAFKEYKRLPGAVLDIMTRDSKATSWP